MRAVVLHAAGGPEQLVLEQITTPAPGPDEALVRVHAAALTRDELEWPVDRLPAIPSYELSGVVAELGPGVDRLAVGDHVYGMTAFDRDGVAADYAAINAELLAPKPRALSHPEAAAVPLAALSAWQGLFEHGGLAAGERVLIHGATGGVGQFATPLASRHGAHVTATTSARDVERARELGADATVDHASGDVVAAVKEATGGAGVDVVLEHVGEATWQRSLQSARAGGRIVVCGATTGPNPPAALHRIWWKQLTIYGSTMGTKEDFEGAYELVKSGRAKPVVDSIFPLEEARAAHERMEAAEQFGKIVLTIP